jgi:hypothetical protein
VVKDKGKRAPTHDENGDAYDPLNAAKGFFSAILVGVLVALAVAYALGYL